MNQYVEMKRRQRREYEKFLVSDLGEEPDRLYCVAPNTYIRKGDFMEFQDMLPDEKWRIRWKRWDIRLRRSAGMNICIMA